MNKKLMSFVLAMVLSVGLGVSSLFANSSRGDYGQSVQNFYLEQNSGASSSSSSGDGFTINVGSPEDVLSGNITTVFSFYAGIMTSYKLADGSVYVNDSDGIRAIMSAANDVWTVTAYNFRQSDLNSPDYPKLEDYVKTDENGNPLKDKDGNYIFVSEQAEKDYVDKWKAFLKKRGFSDEQMRVAVLDETGKPKKDENGEIIYQDPSAGFFTFFQENMAKGGDYTGTISQGNGITGLTATISIDTKPDIVFTSDFSCKDVEDNIPGGVRITATYEYNKGHQTGSTEYTLEASDVNTETGDITYTWKKNVSVTTYQDKEVELLDGSKVTIKERVDITVKGLDVGATQAEVDAAVDRIKDIQFHGGSDEGFTTQYTITRFTANETRKEMWDSKTGNTTKYMNGNIPTKVYNPDSPDMPDVVYDYTENNVMIGYKSVTGVGEDGTAAYETTACDKHGTVQGTVNGDVGYDKALSEIQAVKTAIAEGRIKDIPADSIVKSFSIFGKDLQDPTARANFQKYFGWSDAYVNDMLNFDYGNGAIASVSMAYSEDLASNSNDETADGVQAETTSVSGGTHTQWQTLDHKRTGWTFTSTILIGGASAYQCVRNVVTSDVTVLEKDPAVEGSLYPSDDDINNISEEDKEKMREAGLDPDNKEDVKSYLIDKKADELGVQKYDEDGNLTEEYKLLQEGFYYDKETGKTYAVLSVSSVYLMDGSEDFQTVTGETMLVDLGTEGFDAGKTKAESIKKDIGSDNKIMFMGRVGSNGDGQLILEMEESWSGGYVTNTMDKNIEDVKNDIVKLSNAVYNLKAGNISQEEYAAIVGEVNGDGAYDWVIENSAENIDKFFAEFGSGAHFSWDATDEEGRTGLRYAWNLLF